MSGFHELVLEILHNCVLASNGIYRAIYAHISVSEEKRIIGVRALKNIGGCPPS